MNLTEQHIIKFNKELDWLTFQSKNVYNSCLYIIRQYFFQHQKYIGFSNLYHSIKKEEIWEKSNLPKKVLNQIVKIADQNFSSFFKSLQNFKKNPEKFLGKPKIPSYKDPESGRFILIYEKGAISKKEFNKSGKIHPSKTNLKINTKIKNFEDIRQVRIVPKSNHFVVEIIYSVKEKNQIQNNNYAAIDIGVNNLAVVSFNNGKNPFSINGRPLKSINQFYNCKKSKIQSILERRNNKKRSNQLQKLTDKRNRKVKDYLHKSSALLVNQLVSRNVSILIIGRNKNWKQDINIGKVNNQNFVNIPFYVFINMLKYKCKLNGIMVIEQEESYTSKCSFIDKEEIRKHVSYMGSRIKRGIFKSAKGKLINADLNGSYNILRKAISKNSLKGINGIEGFAVSPLVLTP